MTVTEIGCCGIKPGLRIMDESTPEGKIYMGVYKKLNASPEGPHRMYLSVDLDEPFKVYSLFDWDSLEHHEKFANTFGEGVQEDFGKVLTHGEYTKHITPTPPLQEALESAVTDVFLVHCPSDISPDDKVTTELRGILKKGFGQHADVTAISYGWGVENDFPVYGIGGGMVGSVFSAFVGWASVEANTTCREAAAHTAIQESIRRLYGVEALKVLRSSCAVLERNDKR
ncbi:hypothetical protein CGRA01v4_04196 [Colletotrichum graminicola]|uniref:Uncharacterized protein n=1 Tax=Colletotrichum graminicola (strain M1.001 / M2 / FGSC 10212) TaxID=645133 RepID=E3QVK0_COLGM|nr:uncharacterized protein GLRG_10032 [Colletotrichum graminicola M1.001]EFQ34888.1 hypothetical protein GLRG_10032 [Colletotrichum graminicola M1.001]WDK12915.1 hypothetical protein CGRA01v4_04196 [Colletotrichum graminicola]